jgi:hypothetical protein
MGYGRGIRGTLGRRLRERRVGEKLPVPTDSGHVVQPSVTGEKLS